MSEETPEQATSDDTPDRVTGRTITRWEWPLHRVALAVYVLVLVVYIVRVGVPIDRIGQTGWILVGIVAARLGRPLRDHARAVLDWLPLLAALILYDHTRGIADSLACRYGSSNWSTSSVRCSVACCRPPGCRSISPIRPIRSGGTPWRRSSTRHTSSCRGRSRPCCTCD